MTRTKKSKGKRSAGFQPAATGDRRKAQAGSPRYVERPFVLVNMAMTADGKIATANRKVSSFGTHHDHENLYALRATADAILCGARTVDLNAVSLGSGGRKFELARKRRGLAKQALRIVVSGSGSINPRAHIFTTDFAPLIVVTTKRASKTKLRQLGKLADLVCVCGKMRVDWVALLQWLRGHFNVRRLLVEGGGELNAELFRADLVDELHLTICPKLVGGRSAPTIADGPNPVALAEAAEFPLHRRRRAGDELFLTFRRAAK